MTPHIDPPEARDLRRPDHLPKQRADGKAPHPSWLPRQRRGVTPQMVGRYPDYNVFDAIDTWDPVTRKTVLERLEISGPLRFFDEHEEPTLRAFCDTAVAQDTDPRIPVAEMVDQKYAQGKLDGYRYEDMPPDPETWHIVLRGLDETARERHGTPFSRLEEPEREAIVGDFADAKLKGGAWEEVNVSHAFSVVMRGVLSEFYSHPWAWNEIGFGGPAYPRGFIRLGEGPFSREPFEKPGATDEDPVPLADKLQ